MAEYAYNIFFHWFCGIFEELCMELVFVVFKKWHQIVYRATLHQANTECHFLHDAMCCLSRLVGSQNETADTVE